MAVEGGNAAAGNDILEIAKAATPVVTAFLAAWLALVANRFLDRKRAFRDYVTNLSDSYREDVRTAVEAAADYWGTHPTTKCVLEARIKMLESEIRAGGLLIAEGDTSNLVSEFTSAQQDFIAVLTGADFEAATVAPNPTHVRELTGKGVFLRKAAARLRRQQIGHAPKAK